MNSTNGKHTSNGGKPENQQILAERGQQPKDRTLLQANVILELGAAVPVTRVRESAAAIAVPDDAPVDATGALRHHT